MVGFRVSGFQVRGRSESRNLAVTCRHTEGGGVGERGYGGRACGGPGLSSDRAHPARRNGLLQGLTLPACSDWKTEPTQPLGGWTQEQGSHDF